MKVTNEVVLVCQLSEVHKIADRDDGEFVLETFKADRTIMHM